MGVYRGDKPKNRQPPAKSPAPAGPRQPDLRQRDTELAALNQHRQRHGHDPLIDPSSPTNGAAPGPDGDEGPAPDEGGDSFYRGDRNGDLAKSGSFYQGDGDDDGPSGGLGQQALRAARSQAGKRAALAASGIFGPLVIALAILLFALGAGLPTEQVAQAVVGVRFSRIHGQIAKRMGHIRDSHHLWTSSPNQDFADIHRRPASRGGLVVRLAGVGNDKIYRNLSQHYDLEFGRRCPVVCKEKLIRIRSKTQKVTGADGRRRGKILFELGSSDPELSSYRRLAELGDVPTADNWRGRLLARRSVFWLGQSAGFKFNRLRGALAGIKKHRQQARAPPAAGVVSLAVSDDIITEKNSLRRFQGLLRLRIAGLFDLGDQDIEAAGRHWSHKTPGWFDKTIGGKIDNSKLAQKLKSSPQFRSKLTAVAGWARKTSIFTLVATLFCTAYEIVDLVRQVAKVKILQHVDTAASLFTTSSQIKAGETDYAIVNDSNRRFEGFGHAPTYQLLYDANSVRNYDRTKTRVASVVGYASERFDIKGSFGLLFQGLDWFIGKALNWLRAIYNSSYGQGFQRAGISFDGFLSFSCGLLLNPFVQLALAVGLLALEAGLALVSGGAWLGVRAAVTAIVHATVFAFGVGLAINASGVDEALVVGLMAEAVAISSGPQSALVDGSTPPAETAQGGLRGLAASFLGVASADSGQLLPGVENYLAVDYGAWHLSAGQGLAEGAGLIDPETAIAQDRVYWAQHRQDYRQEGVWANIVDPRNPYSLMAQMQSRLPGGGLRAQPSQIRSTVGWLAASPSVWLGSATAQNLSQEDQIALLYPGQSRSLTFSGAGGESYQITEVDRLAGLKVVGFDEGEVSGVGEFDFVTNSDYVEANMDRLRQVRDAANNVVFDYADCLAIDIGEFRLYQAGITKTGGGSYYPSRCQDPDARRYMIYYQDCLHISTLERIGTNSSPMLASDCDDLLPGRAQTLLDTTASSTQTSNMAGLPEALSRITAGSRSSSQVAGESNDWQPRLAAGPTFSVIGEVRRWNFA